MKGYSEEGLTLYLLLHWSPHITGLVARYLLTVRRFQEFKAKWCEEEFCSLQRFNWVLPFPPRYVLIYANKSITDWKIDCLVAWSGAWNPPCFANCCILLSEIFDILSAYKIYVVPKWFVVLISWNIVAVPIYHKLCVKGNSL